MKMKKINLNDLKPASYNPRKISDSDMSKLENSIKNFGFVEPIIINLNNNRIIGGHQRFEALHQIGFENNEFQQEFNLIELGDIGLVFKDEDIKLESEEKEKALNIALNKISGEFDEIKLKPLLNELKPLNRELTGFTDLELKKLDVEINKEVIEDNYTEPEKIEVKIKTGDIYRLGQHRLMCGDSTQEEDVKKLMNNELADMIFTDFPFDFNENDKVIQNILKYTQNNAEIFIMHTERQLAKLITKNEKIFRRLFTVDFKVPHLINNNSCMTQTDYIAHFRKESPTRFRNLKDRFSTLIQCAKIHKENKNNFFHKQAKKVELPSNFIQHYTEENELVLDLFGGSGSTLIACE